MDIEQSLTAHLGADSTVNALVGSRIYPLTVPEDATLPALAYQRISTPRTRSHNGPSGLAQPRFQLTMVGNSVSSVRSLATAVRQSLDGFTGQMGGSGGVQVGFCAVMNEQDDFLTGLPGEIVCRIDVSIGHQEV